MQEYPFPVLIKSNKELRQFCHYASADNILAIDTEFIREKNYYPDFALLQLGTRDCQVVVDPYTVTDFDPLLDLLKNQRITKIFHAPHQDLDLLYHKFNTLPKPIFDVQLAQSFLSTSAQIGYANLVEQYCGVRLMKSESLTDWSLRPLDARQIKYALEDVKYLPQIHEMQVQKLSDLQRLEWLSPYFEDMIDEKLYQSNAHEAYKKLKRVSGLKRGQLAVARELAAWRELRAAERNIVRRHLISDELIVELSKKQPRSLTELGRMRGLEQLSTKERLSLVEAVKKGLDCPLEEQPGTLERHQYIGKDVESVADLMASVVRLVSEQEKISSKILCSRDDLVKLAQDPNKDNQLTQGWRHKLIGETLLKLLNGKIGLTVSKGHIEFLV